MQWNIKHYFENRILTKHSKSSHILHGIQIYVVDFVAFELRKCYFGDNNNLCSVNLRIFSSNEQLIICFFFFKNSKPQTVIKLTVVPCAPVVEVKIKRPDTKYQLGFSVQNGVVSIHDYFFIKI